MSLHSAMPPLCGGRCAGVCMCVQCVCGQRMGEWPSDLELFRVFCTLSGTIDRTS